MSYLIDTNVLVRLAQPKNPHQRKADRALKALRRQRESGKQAHDARLVAAMTVHKLTHILTFNTDDFKRYDGITVVDPSSVK